MNKTGYEMSQKDFKLAEVPGIARNKKKIQKIKL